MGDSQNIIKRFRDMEEFTIKQPQQEWADEHLSVVRTKELIRAEIQKQKQNLIDSIGRISNKELNSAHHILCVLESFINTIPEKSIEWTEDDENKVTLFMQLVEGCDNYEELSNWLKSLKERVIPQPKTDWSEEENHRKFYETLGWRKCQHEELNQSLNIRTSESGHRYLIVDGYEIEIETLLKLPKED